MRLLNNPNVATSEPPPVRFTTVIGQVYTIALKYPSGKLYPSQRPGLPDSVMFSLADGRRAWFSPEVARLIDELHLAPGEPFTVCNLGSRRGWQVLRRPPAPEPEPPPAAASSAPAAAPVTAPAAVVVTPPAATRLEHALRTAIQAASNAERFATEIGYPIRFDADAVKSMAITVLINSTDGGARR